MDLRLYPRPARSAAGGDGAGRRAVIRYEIRQGDGSPADADILERFYGATWRTIMGRLSHRHDGYLLTIHEGNRPLKIYRILEQGP